MAGSGEAESRNAEAQQASELDEQLADALYKRAEAKLMIEDDLDVIAGALADSLRVSAVCVSK
jgi:hypothetical protein